jgi:outer membrane receptor for ferrienterochelin and colicins
MKGTILLALLVVAGLFATAQPVNLQGTITGKGGVPLPGVTITVQPAGKTVASDEQGKYQVNGLAAGAIILTANSVGYKTYAASFQLSEKTVVKHIRMEAVQKDLQQVEVVGAQRSQANTESLIKVENSIMPVTIIDRRTIELMGSRRLDDVLKEQTGVAIVNDIGGGSRSIGVQMQGFSSEYVMVLIDGQPMIGRNSGNFDLSRISVANIERVEITKGAASNIYGGDALGGTINIITRQVVKDPQAMAAISYGSNETIDVTADGETPLWKGAA